MLTVVIKPTFISTYTRWFPESIEDPNELFTHITEDTYFYIDGASEDRPVKESLLFNIEAVSMENIPENCVVDNVKISFRTQKDNAYGVYDNISLKFDGNLIANIDATLKGNNIETTDFTATTLNGAEISKDVLKKGLFEIEMASQGPAKLKLFYIVIQISYTEIYHTSVCKINCRKGLITLPLYNPVPLARYALRISTSSGIKAFDLVNVNSSSASPLRIMTNAGIMAVRMLQDYEDPEYANSEYFTKSIVNGRFYRLTFSSVTGANLERITEEEVGSKPYLIEWILLSPNNIKYRVTINEAGSLVSAVVRDPNTIAEIFKIRDKITNNVYIMGVTDEGYVTFSAKS